MLKLSFLQRRHYRQYVKNNPGQIVGHIKIVRGLTGWGLKEAKAYVDANRNPKLFSQNVIDDRGYPV